MTIEDRVETAVTEAEAAAIAGGVFAVEAAARSLPGEYDDNFFLAARDDRRFVLKVMHPAREWGFVEMQCQALQHLARRAPHLALPRVCPTASGETIVTVPTQDGTPRLVWMLTHVPGTTLAEARPHSPELLASLGRMLGEMDTGLADFSHPAAERELKWDLTRAGWIRPHLHYISDPSRRALVEWSLALWENEVVPALPALRRSVVYGDANDHNVLVGDARSEPRQVVSVVDFGDMHRGITVSEPAIAAAYAILGENDPVAAAAQVVAGYHGAFPLDETEIGLIYPLIAARLAVSVTNSAWRRTLRPDDPYVTISETPAWDALERLARVHPRFACAAFRAACGLPPVPEGEAVMSWLRTNAEHASPVLDVDLRTAPSLVFDLSVGSRFLGADPHAAETEAMTESVFREMRKAGVAVGIGRYDEARGIYMSPAFAGGGRPTDERRTVHLGIDLFVEPGSPIHSPLAGVVHTLANNSAPQDYGPLVILRHETGDGLPFHTLYGHLSEDTPAGLSVGQRVEPGREIGRVGAPPTNGGWTPHVHVQLILDLLDKGADFPGVAFPGHRAVWAAFSPDPNVLLGVPAERFAAVEPVPEETLAGRREHLARNLSVSYRRPLKIVRAWMQYLYDETGRAYLDVFNNVPLVGHSHPRVVRAVQEQIALLNTNTRYLHDTVVRYAGRLTRLLPEPLSVCTFINSGSEANELALRLARTHTGREDLIVLEHAYHGHTTTLVDVSPYKFDGPGGRGRKPWVHEAFLPDDYRGPYRRDDPQAGAKYARHVAEVLDDVRAQRRGVAAYLAETFPSVAGQVVLPPGYLADAYRYVRAAGGVCIADEVQTGFGRLGTHFWGFEAHGVVPDIVVLGKPIGNGFPLAAVVTTPEIAASFDNGMEFFSTFGGNPVACAAGLAVLDVLEDERLQERALRVGRHLVAGLQGLKERYALIGDVRGSGLFLGVELVRDRGTLEPAVEEATYVVNRLRECGILTGADGPHHTVLKLRPPLVFSESDADLFLESLDAVLQEDPARPVRSVDWVSG
ncbi:MAG: aminotransferase class III-fold pyridoxal phosphate-dependent enzyme [Acidobacteriia bacterium]|nr:aminotransferase class III-fold pyridoxal phosphate-dependent enzyme [Terriglobia bacterium]